MTTTDTGPGAATREVCFYCRKPIRAELIEQDHAPIPKRHGGTSTVPACIPCHDLKDRIPLSAWSEELMVQAFEECGQYGRILLAKAFGVVQDREAHARSA